MAEVRFEDVMVYFSAEEMGMLEPWQRALYFEVLKENYESLIVIGNPVTSADVIAWFKQGKLQSGAESQGLGAGDSSATDEGLGQIHSKRYTETPEPPKVVDGRSEEEKAQCGNLGGTPGDSRVPFTHPGSPRRDECMPHLEKATGGPASPTRSQDAATAPKPYKCQECGDRFRLKGLLAVHRMVTSRKPSHACPVCGICFPSGWHLKRHQRLHKGACPDSGGVDCLDACPGTRAEERSHFCADCGKDFRWYLHFLQHQKSHEEEEACLCAQCNAVFMYRSDLAVHEESHFDEASCVSSGCGENCVCRLSLLLHLAPRLEKSTENGGTDSPEDEKLHREDGGLGQIHPERYTETVEPPKIVDGRSEEGKARYGSLGGTPGDSRVPFTHPGSPRRDECMPRLEKATGGSASPTRSQDAATAPKPYQCQECGDQFRLKGLLAIHQMVSLRKPAHACPVCGICFPSCWHLKRHQRLHRGACPDSGGADCLDACPGTRLEERSHFCADCGKDFRWYLSFLQHQKSHEKEEVCLCAQCNAAFMYRSDLAVHEESHFDEALCVSSACGESCVCRLSLLLHFASRFERSTRNGGTDSPEDERPPWEGKRKGEKPFSCHRCGGQFRLEENLEAHYRYCYKDQLQKHRHRLTSPGHETTGDKRARNRSAPKRSRNRSSPPSDRPPARWACADCKKSFSSRYSLFKHRQSHKAEARRSAAELDKSTRPASGSGGRALVGIMKKLHKCQECGKRFVFKRQLVRHMRAHGGGLGAKDHFEKRRRVHSGERALRSRRREDFSVPPVSADPGRQGEKDFCQCSECGKTLTKAYFPDHQAWHRGVRFMCRLCGSLSNFRSGCHRHLQRHRTRGDFSSCPQCGMRSQSKSCFCLIERIYLGQEPLPPLYNQEGTSRPTEDLWAKDLPSPPATNGASLWEERWGN